MNHLKNGLDIYSDLSYHLLSSFQWILNHSMEGSRFSVVD